MPASILHAGRFRLLSIAGAICLLIFTGSRSPAALQHGAPAHSAFEKAQRMREALEGRPERQRTRRDYERVIEAYRAIYHGDPGSPRADASVSAVGDLLAEEGRIFQDEKALHDAIAQYEFLRKQYPGSRYRFSALLTEGEIYLRDLNDRESARATFQQFLKLYPQSPLANEARLELANLKHGRQPARGRESVAQAAPASAPAETAATKASSRKRTVLTAAIQSQGGHGTPPQPARSTEAARSSVNSNPAQGLEESDLPSPAANTVPAVTPHEEDTSKHLSDAVLNAP